MEKKMGNDMANWDCRVVSRGHIMFLNAEGYQPRRKPSSGLGSM